jgi:hypothetical protein
VRVRLQWMRAAASYPQASQAAVVSISRIDDTHHPCRAAGFMQSDWSKAHFLSKQSVLLIERTRLGHLENQARGRPLGSLYYYTSTHLLSDAVDLKIVVVDDVFVVGHVEGRQVARCSGVAKRGGGSAKLRNSLSTCHKCQQTIVLLHCIGTRDEGPTHGTLYPQITRGSGA